MPMSGFSEQTCSVLPCGGLRTFVAMNPTLGRPKGRAETMKLDARADEIRRYLAKDISKRAIAKLVDCSKSTLYNWLEREGLNKKKPPSKDKQETT